MYIYVYELRYSVEKANIIVVIVCVRVYVQRWCWLDIERLRDCGEGGDKELNFVDRYLFVGYAFAIKKKKNTYLYLFLMDQINNLQNFG